MWYHGHITAAFVAQFKPGICVACKEKHLNTGTNAFPCVLDLLSATQLIFPPDKMKSTSLSAPWRLLIPHLKMVSYWLETMCRLKYNIVLFFEPGSSIWINKHFSCLNIFQVWKPSKVQKLLRKSQKNWRQSQEAQMKLNPKHRRSRKVRTNLSGSFSQYLTCHNRKPRFYSQLQQRFFDIVPIIHFEFFTPAPFLLWCVKENGFRVCETQINSMCLVD